MRSQGFGSLRSTHYKLRLRVIDFQRKYRTGYKPVSCVEILERTGSERIETTIWKSQLGFIGAFIRQGNSRPSERVMFGRLAVQGPKRGWRPVTSWVDYLQKTSRPSGRSRAKAKEGSGSQSELFTWIEGIR